jgi:hypothetical protein
MMIGSTKALSLAGLSGALLVVSAAAFAQGGGNGQGGSGGGNAHSAATAGMTHWGDPVSGPTSPTPSARSSTMSQAQPDSTTVSQSQMANPNAQ